MLSETTDNMLAGYALILADVPRKDNPFADLIEPGISNIAAWLGSERVALAERSKTAPLRQSGLAACAEDDIAWLNGAIIPQFRAITDEALEMDAGDNILDFMVDVISFRDMLWADVPPCREALELSLMMRQIVSDFVAAFTLEQAGAAIEDILYLQEIESGLEAFTVRSDAIAADMGSAPGRDPAALNQGVPVMRVYGSELSSCSVIQASLLAVRLVLVHKTIIEQAAGQEIMADLNAYADVSSSDRIWSNVPHCAEAIEVSWFVGQVAGDFAAADAFQIAGISPDVNPYQQQAEAGVSRFEEIFGLVHTEGWIEPFSTEDDVLPECSAADLAVLDEITWEFEDSLVGIALNATTNDDLLRYSEAHIAWRERFWIDLPGCAEAVQIGVLMGAIVSDFATAFALNVSGVDVDYNPFLLRALGNWLAFVDQTIMKDILVSEENASKTYYVTANPYVNIRSCAATSWHIVATAQNGEALTVIDDTKDWYEVRLDNGETAFIAGFLMSNTRPDG